VGGIPVPPPPPAGTVQTQQRAEAVDIGVPRYRPRVTMAESQLDVAGMQLRANWQRNFAFGHATEANVTVPGWRQPDGTLWRINRMARCGGSTGWCRWRSRSSIWTRTC
jgi:prophage tail gpP-like protein